jgi:hypothetical protein
MEGLVFLSAWGWVLLTQRKSQLLTAATFGFLVLGATHAPPAWGDGGKGDYSGMKCDSQGCDVYAVTPGKRARSASRHDPKVRNIGGRGTEILSDISTGSAFDSPEFKQVGLSGILVPVGAGKPRVVKRDGRVSDGVVARRVVEEVRLPRPVIHTSPDEDFAQVVGVPTWLWVDRAGWGSVTKSVELPGLRVVATARPREAVWSMGEGGSVVCRGPGTPFSVGFRPEDSSPDCGYTYRRSSAGESDRAFGVSVRVVWDVEWHGGGRRGVVRGLVISAERRLVVDEVQAVVVR